jgi:hypothetical protein
LRLLKFPPLFFPLKNIYFQILGLLSLDLFIYLLLFPEINSPLGLLSLLFVFPPFSFHPPLFSFYGK